MPAHLLQDEMASSYTTTTTITEPPSRKLQNGDGKLEKNLLYAEEDIRPEMKDDYSASEYRWHINFTTFFIDCMAALGLAYDRKKVSKEAVLARVKRTGDGSYKSG
ncbi:stearoyl-CoA desaturase [Phyllostomus discolor]|uniref:Stearoyl-CoA desaturase n=1 Tax=Phyllostomus discolor TaxID=89673 RepID=A0A834EBU8_9CHIR|nr:stearoyl-CoA desaturase [Phyllostomus discolor]